MAIDVFISYGRRDQDNGGAVKRLYDAIIELGYAVWWDQKIPPGVPYAYYIAQRLEQARVVIVLWGEASVTSRWVYEEAERAMLANKYVPVKLESCTIPLGFGALQSIDFSQWDHTADAPCFVELKTHLEETLGVGSAVGAEARQQTLFKLLSVFHDPYHGGGFDNVHQWNMRTKLSTVMDLNNARVMNKVHRVLSEFELLSQAEDSDDEGPVFPITESTTIGDIVDVIMQGEGEDYVSFGETFESIFGDGLKSEIATLAEARTTTESTTTDEVSPSSDDEDAAAKSN